jgi:hypothetical protein
MSKPPSAAPRRPSAALPLRPESQQRVAPAASVLHRPSPSPASKAAVPGIEPRSWGPCSAECHHEISFQHRRLMINSLIVARGDRNLRFDLSFCPHWVCQSYVWVHVLLDPPLRNLRGAIHLLSDMLTFANLRIEESISCSLC